MNRRSTIPRKESSNGSGCFWLIVIVGAVVAYGYLTRGNGIASLGGGASGGNGVPWIAGGDNGDADTQQEIYAGETEAAAHPYISPGQIQNDLTAAQDSAEATADAQLSEQEAPQAPNSRQAPQSSSGGYDFSWWD